MSAPGKRATPAPRPLSAEKVLSYLRENPSFLADHPELAAVLTPPSQPEESGVVDLQRFMIERLQNEVRDLRARQKELLAAGRVNLSSQERIHSAVLAIIEARTLEDLARTVAEDFRSMLDVTATALCFEGAGGAAARNAATLAPGTIAEIMGERDILLRRDVAGDARLFGERAAGIRSDALVRLAVGGRETAALLALGSPDAERFHPGQGTELLAFLARALTGSLRGWLADAA